MKDPANEKAAAAEERVKAQECDLVQVEEGLEESTQFLFEEFTEGRIDATMTTTGLQLVQDARQACAQGDPNACRRMELIERFIQGVGHKESAE